MLIKPAPLNPVITQKTSKTSLASNSSKNIKCRTGRRSKKLPKTEEIKDEFELFGQQVGMQLRKMPLKDALESQVMIQKTMINQRLKASLVTESERKAALLYNESKDKM